MGVRRPTSPVAAEAVQIDGQHEEHSTDWQNPSERHEAGEHSAREVFLVNRVVNAKRFQIEPHAASGPEVVDESARHRTRDLQYMYKYVSVCAHTTVLILSLSR